MTKLSHYTPALTGHTKDVASYAAVEGFINTFKARHKQFKWFGSRTSDILRLQCLHEGLLVELSNMITKEHASYIQGCGIDSGRRKNQEVVLKVKDISERWGRVTVVNERFDARSTLFPSATELFELIWQQVKVAENRGNIDRLSYPSSVKNVTKLFL